jgi:hypothetical protein
MSTSSVFPERKLLLRLLLLAFLASTHVSAQLVSLCDAQSAAIT